MRKRLVSAIALLGLSIGMWFGIGRQAHSAPDDHSAIADVVRTKRLELVGKDGQSHLVMDIGEGDTPRIGLYGKDSKLRIAISVLPDGQATISVLRPDGSQSLGLRSMEEGSALAFWDKEKKLRFALGQVATGEPALVFIDAEGKVVSTVPGSSNTTASRPNASPTVPGVRVPATGWIETVSDDGSIIKLNDGSVWQVHFLDQIRTSLWLPVTKITVTKSTDVEYRYLLVNERKGQTARVKLLSP